MPREWLWHATARTEASSTIITMSIDELAENRAGRFWGTNGKHAGGRPTKRTPEVTEQICEGIAYGLTDEEVAALVGIDDSTMTRWKKEPEFCGAIKKAQAIRLLIRLKRIEKGERGWQGTAWAMERQDPERFGSPEARLRRKEAEDPDKLLREVIDYVGRLDPRIRELTGG
jgi:hypothetical protein